jgi:medium-chain acyl-[acyl-carrier-protein] hydrolase
MIQPERPAPPSPWVMRPPRPSGGPAKRLRLFCLPYAGGSASIFRAWPARLPREVDVCAIQPPGRGNRLVERPCVRMDELLPPLVDAVLPLLDLPYALFGHSLGALVAFELARRLRSRTGTGPVLLVVSACRGPHLPDHAARIHGLPDDQFLARLAAVNGIPAEVLESRDLIDLLLPLLRADVEMAETYRFSAGAPLGCAISALWSEDDPYVSRADAEAWSAHTTADFSSHSFPGGHFFVHSAENALLDVVDSAIQPNLAASTGAQPGLNWGARSYSSR